MLGAVIEVSIGAKCVQEPGGGTRPVLRDVRFSAVAGEFLALFGPSGIGKTTTLRLILGLDADFAGSVSCCAGRVGVMFQEPRLLPWLTVADNLRLVVIDPAQAHRTFPACWPRSGCPAWSSACRANCRLAWRAASRWHGRLRLIPICWCWMNRSPRLIPRSRRGSPPWCRAGLGAAARPCCWRHTTSIRRSVSPTKLMLAGEPATLAADMKLPEPRDSTAVGTLRATLVAQFPFLDHAEPAS